VVDGAIVNLVCAHESGRLQVSAITLGHQRRERVEVQAHTYSKHNGYSTQVHDLSGLCGGNELSPAPTPMHMAKIKPT